MPHIEESVYIDRPTSEVFEFGTDPDLLLLLAENIGQTLARDVKLTFNPPLRTTFERRAIENSSLVTEGVPSMPPGRRIEGLFD